MRISSWAAGVSACALAVLLAVPASAQERGTVTGQVRAAQTQRPLVGAQVYLPGTNVGTVTNSEGRYVMRGVPLGQQRIQVQLIGFKQAEQSVLVAAGGTVTADFTLSESAVALDEIVVTGTSGGARKRELGNSVSSISAKDIETAPVSSAQEILAGRATGVTVMMNSGQPGSGATIRLRGNNSISQTNNPLIYVDGVRINSDYVTTAWAARQATLPVNDINPDDIERVEIVKGAAATTLYGTEASGGVIQIFTKKGQATAPLWAAEVSGGFNDMDHVGPDGDPTGLFLKECRGANLFAVDHGTGEFEKFEDPTCPESGSWIQKGPIQRYNVSVRGGSPTLTYYVSGSYDDEDGAIQTGNDKHGGIRGNFSFRPTEQLDIAVNTSYLKRVTRWVPDGNNASGFLLNVGRGPFNNFKNSAACTATDITACVVNGEITDQQNFNRQDHFLMGLTLRHDATANLSNRVTLGWDYTQADNQTLYPFGYLRVPKGLIYWQNLNRTLLSTDYVGNYRRELGRDLTSATSWGGQLFEDRFHETQIDAFDFAGPGEPTLESAARKDVWDNDRLRVITGGFFFQEMVGWKDRLFLTAGLRVDGNSAFGEEFGLQPYPKLSLAYVVSDHAFWPTDWLETFKLRGAWGESGKAPGAFDATRTWDPIAGDAGKPGFTPNQIGNPALGPERSREIELGFESSAFSGRLGVDFTYYSQRTLDALVQVLFPASQGFSARQLQNVGELKNHGIELQVNAGLWQNDWLDWRARFGYSTINSEAVDLGGQEVSLGNDNWAKAGFPVPSYFGRKIMNPDEVAEPKFEEDQALGPSYPTDMLNIGTTITLRNDLTLDVLGEGQYGHYLQNWVGYQNARRGIWFPCYDVQQKLVQAKKGNAAALAGVTARQRSECAINRTVMNDSYWVHKADFFKLRSASLTYQLPANLVPGTKSASVTVAGRNLATWTDYDGADPEARDSRDGGFGIARREYYNLPPLRQFLASVRVTF